MTHTFPELVVMARERVHDFLALSRAECVAATKTYALEKRAEIRRSHETGASGANIVAQLTELADTILQGVFEFALTQVRARRVLVPRLSLIALGGYGRGHLNPHSDLDICLLYEGKLDKDIEAINAYVVPFLWDIGYETSFVVRNVKQAVELAKTDPRVYTSYLECRLIFGGSAPYARLRLAIRDLRPGDTKESFAKLKLRERSESLPEQYRELYAREPNIKENAGGLRDYQTALWLLTAAFGASTLDEAVSQSLITPDERLELAEALDFLWRVRNDLHFRAGKREDRLTYANQHAVARAFGYTGDGEDNTARLMEDYYAAARTIRRFLRTAARNIDQAAASKLLDKPRPEVSEFIVEDGELYAALADPHWFEENSPRLMAVFWECAKRDVVLSHQTERLIREHLPLVGDAFRSSDLVRRFFVAICNRPAVAGRTLRQMAHTGLLGKYVPEFAAIQGVVRYADFHSYPVDEHTLIAIENLAKVYSMDGPVGGCLKMALEHIADPYILVMALLFHDLGKAAGEEHVEEGARLARDICRRIGMPEEDGERIAFLVQRHLLMSHISLYRDTDDLDIVETFARAMKSSERLRALFLLSYADMAAVAPNVWNDWKGALLMKLYLKTEKFLLGRTETVSDAYWKYPKTDLVRQAAPEQLKDKVEQHIRAFGDRYFIGFSPPHIVTHMECLEEAEKTGLAVRCINNPETDTTELVVCTRDHPGLFAQIAGCLASQLVDINNAMLFTRADGMALDCFTVTNASRRQALTAAQARGVEKVLRAVLIEGKTVEEHLEPARRRLFGLLQAPVPVPTRITFDNDSSRTHTVIDIETGDRTGLLYDIAKTMKDQGLDISSARIFTDARRVRDSFYVTLNSGKVDDKELQAQMAEALQAAIHPRPAVELKGGVK